ncbi:Gustatory receptor 19, partial [Frankliniella occidentalis]
VLSATLTYVIVLVQFREPAYSSASDYRNQSALQSGVKGE